MPNLAQNVNFIQIGLNFCVTESKQQIVNQYKNLLGFLPKGVIRDYDDLEPLGDDYKQAYKPNLTDDEQ